MATARQIAANRRNATRSTGPRTREGKETSRGNALKHGLSGKGVVLPDEETKAVQARVAEWGPEFKPSGEFESWLVEVVAVESVRIDLCFVKDAQIREAKARRAAACWEEDRRAEAEKLAARIAKRPEIVARELRRSAQGVDLLIERWECLADAAAQTGDWNEAQRSMALDLLGVAHDLRIGPHGAGRARGARRGLLAGGNRRSRAHAAAGAAPGAGRAGRVRRGEGDHGLRRASRMSS